MEQAERLGPGAVLAVAVVALPAAGSLQSGRSWQAGPGRSVACAADTMPECYLLEIPFPRALPVTFFVCLFALNDLDVQVPAGAL